MAFWKEVDKVSVRLAFGWILAPENLIHPLQLSSKSCRIQLREVDANTIEQELRIALVTPPLVEDICLSREVEGYTQGYIFIKNAGTGGGW